jgi:uncharacterized protein
MHINVRDIQAESVGYSRAYKVSGEHPNLESVRLTKDIEGEITVSRLESGLLVQGRIETEIELDCDRCLRTFNRPVSVTFKQMFSENPEDDDMPVVDFEIDLAPVIEQEIILSLPIKILHSPDCQGIEDAAGKYDKADAGNRLQDKARITKGTKRGRT